MPDSSLSKNTVPFGLSLALCAVLNAALVVAKEKSKTVAGWMQKLTGHHWITHAVFILAAFFVFGWLFALAQRGRGTGMTAQCLANIIVAGVVAGVAIILGFYLLAD